MRIIDNQKPIIFEFTEKDEELLQKVAGHYSDSWAWKAIWVENKIAALIDIYSGCFPDVYKQDDELANFHMQLLIQHCEIHHRLVPDIKKHNKILKEYKKTTNYDKCDEDIKTQLLIKFNQPFSNKSYFKEIQEKFSWEILEAESKDVFGNVFLYANDSDEIPDYFTTIDQKVSTNKNFFVEIKRQIGSIFSEKLSRVAVIVGNGCVISLLPDIPAADVILLDVEPIVHFFLLYIKKLILESAEGNFDQIQRDLINKIREFSYFSSKKNSYEKNDSISAEMQLLGDKHFLASESRFKQVKAALQNKDLLPVNIDIFNEKVMDDFSVLLKKHRLTISFFNLTNVADYDFNHNLSRSLKNLPLSDDCTIISTSLVGYARDPSRCFVSTHLQMLEKNLKYSYYRNRSELKSSSPYRHAFNF